MKRLIVPSAVASGLAVLALAQILPNAAPQAAEMQMKPPVNVEDIKWGPAPPDIPPGQLQSPSPSPSHRRVRNGDFR
jgi:hypothetical protein